MLEHGPFASKSEVDAAIMGHETAEKGLENAQPKFEHDA